jgi:hypothetical protein
VKHSGTPATHTAAINPSHHSGQCRDDMAETSTKYGLMRCFSEKLFIFAGRNIKTDVICPQDARKANHRRVNE